MKDVVRDMQEKERERRASFELCWLASFSLNFGKVDGRRGPL